MKLTIQFKKLKDDPTVPTKAAEIKARYETIKDRPTMTLQQYLTNCDYSQGIDTGISDAMVDCSMLALTNYDLSQNSDLEELFEEI